MRRGFTRTLAAAECFAAGRCRIGCRIVPAAGRRWCSGSKAREPPAHESSLPVVDIAPFVHIADHDDAARERAARLWDRAMTDVGFAVIIGHGVPHDLVQAVRSGALQFFSQDSDAKLSYTHGPYGNPLGGFTGMGTEAVSRTRDVYGSDGGSEDVTLTDTAAPDLVESFVFKPESSEPAPPSILAAASEYHTELLRVLGSLNHMTAASLHLPQGFFDQYYSPHADVSLRIAYYPPVPEAVECSEALRYGEHTDYTGFTILAQDPADIGQTDAGGLEVMLPNGEWCPVLPQEDAFVVNIGDLYEIWTNGRWRSTVHRVSRPAAGSAAAAAARLSIPFFTGPHADAVISALPTCVDEEHPAKYEPISAGEHLMKKLGISNT